MDNNNLSAEEITKVIFLYSKLERLETRIYAQGYLNGLGAVYSAERNTSNESKGAS